MIAKSGGLYGSWTLADEYGFSDVDGNRPHLGRHLQESYGDLAAGGAAANRFSLGDHENRGVNTVTRTPHSTCR